VKKKKLDKVLLEGKPEAAALVLSATEDFAQELAGIIGRFLSGIPARSLSAQNITDFVCKRH
jgi:hypothetical protein